VPKNAGSQVSTSAEQSPHRQEGAEQCLAHTAVAPIDFLRNHRHQQARGVLPHLAREVRSVEPGTGRLLQHRPGCLLFFVEYRRYRADVPLGKIVRSCAGLGDLGR
jgi:hypothetical protein